MKNKFKHSLAVISDFLEGAFKVKASSIIRKEASDLNDDFMLLLFGDFLGIPNPFSYFALEFLPLFVEELESWEKRISIRKSIVAEKAGQYDFCC
ncbi:hypothetical protein NLD30_05935 [SCandidatus Aminicenantes bacterium Aminicenantia_JdfR_composite]|jgi:hypothetical protein|nr:hypothetical protein [SCandidatus Aminicenantes bacterium Aminicenantia_JdfR_composite]MCP2597914.1 hypothetical protein [Candidatus Aminicenantes bacterium AC-335-L06]MCP2606103.1 hypothetical protein [Candidatus Aminicenantes bacterium AC-708-I09]